MNSNRPVFQPVGPMFYRQKANGSMPAWQGTSTAYSWGDDINSTLANYYASSIAQTVNVGQYSANSWGFFDMLGNVAEWTEDWYQQRINRERRLIHPVH